MYLIVDRDTFAGFFFLNIQQNSRFFTFLAIQEFDMMKHCRICYLLTIPEFSHVLGKGGQGQGSEKNIYVNSCHSVDTCFQFSKVQLIDKCDVTWFPHKNTV